MNNQENLENSIAGWSQETRSALSSLDYQMARELAKRLDEHGIEPDGVIANDGGGVIFVWEDYCGYELIDIEVSGMLGTSAEDKCWVYELFFFSDPSKLYASGDAEKIAAQFKTIIEGKE